MANIFSKIFFFLCIGWACTQPGATPAREPRPVAHVSIQPQAAVVKTKVGLMAAGPDRNSAINSAAIARHDSGDSEGHGYGTVLATVVLMAAIAIRRQRSGRP